MRYIEKAIVLCLFGLFLALQGPTTGHAQAKLLDAPRAQGLVGERFDGYAVVRQSSPAAEGVVAEVNAQRRQIYAQRAQSERVPAAQVGRVYAAEIVKRAPAGTWFLGEDGRWTRK